MTKALLLLPLLMSCATMAIAGESHEATDDVQTGRSVAKTPQTYWLNEDLNRLSSLLPKDAPVFTDAPSKK